MGNQILKLEPKLEAITDSDNFLVLQTELPFLEAEEFFLSPELMRWSENLWIIDLSASKRYWQSIAMQENTSLLNVITKQIQKKSDKITKWVLCEHPWQALLMIKKLPPSPTAYFYRSSYLQNLFNSLSWEEWLRPYDLLFFHLKQLSLNYTPIPTRQFLRAMQLIGFDGPAEASSIEQSSLQKRYGLLLAQIWDWSFLVKKEDLELSLFQNLPDLRGFPWIAHKLVCDIKVQRVLDYSIELWEHIEHFLKEDFLKLSKHSGLNKQQHICQLDWHIQVYSGESHIVRVQMRNPYHIQGDAPDFESLILQSKIQFEAWQSKIKEQIHFNDYPEAHKITAWTLEITSLMYLSEDQQSFTNTTSDINYRKILDLENKLPKAIEQYSMDNSHDALLNFHLKKVDFTNPDSVKHSPRLIAKIRPLYVYSTACQSTASSKYLHFLERGSRAWWLTNKQQHYIRDFFFQLQQQAKKWLCRENDELFEIASFD